MTLRTRFLITALFLCHQVLASALVTSQLPSAKAAADDGFPSQDSGKKIAVATSGAPCGTRAASVLKDGTIPQPSAPSRWKNKEMPSTKCTATQKSITAILHPARPMKLTYNSDSGEATASGHFTLDGGPNDDHIKASHGTYNITAETGRFYDVIGTTGLRFTGKTVVLTSTALVCIHRKNGGEARVQNTTSGLYDAEAITTCELPASQVEVRRAQSRGGCRRQREHLPQYVLALRTSGDLFSPTRLIPYRAKPARPDSWCLRLGGRPPMAMRSATPSTG